VKGHVCIHLYFCLFQQNPSTEGSLKPVMVWFHGGGFTGGSGSSELYGPDFLVAEDVVMVTLNYRLGPFGNYIRYVVCCHFCQSIRKWRHVLPSFLPFHVHISCNDY